MGPWEVIGWKPLRESVTFHAGLGGLPCCNRWQQHAASKDHGMGRPCWALDVESKFWVAQWTSMDHTDP